MSEGPPYPVRPFDPQWLAAQRHAAAQWAADLLASGDFVIFDSETTGLGPEDEFVQLGVIDSRGALLLDTLVRPSRPIPPGASAIHGLTNAHVAGVERFGAVYEALRDALADRVVVVYNVDYDQRILGQTCRLYQRPMIRPARWDCAMKAYARFRGVWDSRYGNFRWHRLTYACSTEGVPVQNAHAAVDDCRLTLALLHKMAAAT